MDEMDATVRAIEDGDVEVSGDNQSEPSEEEDSPPADPSEPSQPDPPQPPPPFQPAAIENLSKGSYGVYSLIPKQPGRDSKFGGYQGTCPFHALNGTLGRRRFFRFKSSGREEHRRVLRQCLFWCLQASEHNRQRLHLSSPLPDDVDVPDIGTLVALQINEKPTSVHTDVELDAMDAAEVAATRARGRGRRGRGRAPDAPARARGRGRRGRGIESALAPAPSSDSSGTSSSDADSDSSD